MALIFVLGIGGWNIAQKTIYPAAGVVIMRLPNCPADLNLVPMGGVCRDTSTGKNRHRGEWEAIP